MTSVRVDFDALGAGAERIGAASDAFARRAGQVGGLPVAVAPDQNASALLERVLDAITDSFRRAASELDDISGGLAATAASYERTEQILANWQVPGGTTL